MKSAPVQCVDCIHFNLRKNGELARLGYGTCGLDGRAGRFESATFERHCEGFSAAPADVAQARRKWLADEDQKFTDALKRVMHDQS